MMHSKWESVDGSRKRRQLVVPEKYKKDVLRELHSSRTAGHLGVTKSREKFRERFYRVVFNKDVRPWNRRWDICARRKSPSTHRPSYTKRLLDIEVSG